MQIWRLPSLPHIYSYIFVTKYLQGAVQIHFFATLKATTSLILVKMLFMFCIFLIFIPYYDSTTDISTPREVITVIIILYSVGEAERKILIFSKKAVKLPRTCTIYIYIYIFILSYFHFVGIIDKQYEPVKEKREF